jgi:hypothetical protein
MLDSYTKCPFIVIHLGSNGKIDKEDKGEDKESYGDSVKPKQIEKDG